MLTEDVLKHLYPAGDAAHITEFVRQCPNIFERFGISDSQNRLHFFLAQIGHESGGLTITAENLNYSAPRLMQVWPSRFPNMAVARQFAHNPQKLANKVYANRLGNGDEASGDGFRYRGQGYIQVTGKDGFLQVGRIAGLDLVSRPQEASAPRTALLVAAACWDWKNCNRKADAGDFVGVTRRINGGTIGLQDRFVWLNRVQQVVNWPLDPANPPPLVQKEVVLSVAQLKAVQLALRTLNLYSGSIDGIFGKNSRAGLKAFQSENGIRPTGLLTAETIEKLGI